MVSRASNLQTDVYGATRRGVMCIPQSLYWHPQKLFTGPKGIVSLKELNLAVQVIMLGEVISPFIGQDKSVTASIRTSVDDQCL